MCLGHVGEVLEGVIVKCPCQNVVRHPRLNGSCASARPLLSVTLGSHTKWTWVCEVCGHRWTVQPNIRNSSREKGTD